MVFGNVLRAAFALGLVALQGQDASAQTKIRFALDWIPGSVHAPFLIAQQKGYYKSEGLDVTIDAGKGSAEVARQLAAGVYDMGFPDINVMIEFAARNPDQASPVVMIGYEQAPAAIFVLKSSGITEPKQLAGRKLGAAANDSTFKLFPAFAQSNGFDAKSVQVQYIDPSLREVLLARGDVDAIPGQVFNSYTMLQAKGVKESDISYFMYNKYNLPLYGNAIAASRQMVKEHPEAVRAFLRATLKGVRDLVKDPEDGVRAVMAFQPLLNAGTERLRLKLAMACCIITPTVLKDGFGGYDTERLGQDIATLVKIYALPHAPKVADIVDPSFLPPQNERMVR